MSNLNVQNEFITITYSPENQYLKIVWKGEIDAAKMETGYSQALQVFLAQKVSRCLIDMADRTVQDPGTEPVITDIFGQLLTIIREPLFVALILAPEMYFNITDHFHYEHLRHDDNHFVIIKHFLNQEAGEEWLSTAAATFLNQ